MSFFVHEAFYRNLAPAADQLITVCGAGALGANLAETLARMGLRQLRVIDRDRVEAHNLSTQPWVQQDVGAAKARVLANMLYRAVGARVDAQHVELTIKNAGQLLRGSALVVDAFDNLPARAAVADACEHLDVPCLHIALNETGDYGCGLWGDAYIATTGLRPLTTTKNVPSLADKRQSSMAGGCDYPLTRPLALLVAAATAEVVVGHLLDGSRRNFEVTLRDLRLCARDQESGARSQESGVRDQGPEIRDQGQDERPEASTGRQK